MEAIIGQRALNILNNFPRGKVHSVFKNAFNAKFHKEIIGFVNSKAYLGPYTVCIDKIYDFNSICSTGQDIVFCRNGFSINNERAMIFDITQVYDYTPCIYNPAEIEQVKIKVKILKTLSQEYLFNENNNSDIDAFISNKFSEFMEGAIKFYKSDVIPPALPPGADELIGLGRGLTPSGDDLLAGFMTAVVFLIIYIAKKYAAGLEASPSPIDAFTTTFLNFVYENSSRTHAISKQMLKTAALGEGPKVMTDLMENIFSEHMEQSRLEQNLRKLLSTGSTSGADMVRGIYTAFTAILY